MTYRSRCDHHHTCERCKRKNAVECDAPVERNYDGFPAWLCARQEAYERLLCDDCEEVERLEEERDLAEQEAAEKAGASEAGTMDTQR